MLIPCPFCGERDAHEFAYLGAADPRRPATPVEQPLDAATLAAWHNYVYLRENPAGANRELWYHRSGCRQWLVVTRDVRTHQVSSAVFAKPPEPAAAGGSV